MTTQHQPAAAAPRLSEAEIAFTNAEFCRFVQEAREQRARADKAEADLARARAEAAALKTAQKRMVSALKGARAYIDVMKPSDHPHAMGSLTILGIEQALAAAPQSEQPPPAAPAAPSAEASDPSWIRRGFSATVHGRSWPYVTCLDCGWLTYTESPTVVHHTADCPHAITPPDHQAGDEP